TRTHDLPADLASALVAAIAHLTQQLASTPDDGQPADGDGYDAAAALLLVHVNLPNLDRDGALATLAGNRIGQLLTRTVDADGVELTKSPGAQYSILGTLLQIRDWATAAKVALPAGYDGRIESMVGYATQILWPNGTIPLMGASVRSRPG